MDIHIALVHHPVLDRAGDVVTTAVTNQDIHDLARTARTYDVASTTLVTPITEQRALVERIVTHWREGPGAHRQPKRAPAFARVAVAPDVAATIDRLAASAGSPPVIVGTSARAAARSLPYAVARRRLAADPGAALILFGTGWGLSGALLDGCDHVLPPIEAIAGRNGYNHLSVRAAVAIILDRLLGADTSTVPDTVGETS